MKIVPRHLCRITTCAGVVVVLMGAEPSAAQQLTVEPQVLTVPKDKAEATGQIQVCNTSGMPVPVKIGLSTFHAPAGVTRTGTIPPKSIPAAGTVLGPGKCMELQVAFADLSQIAMLSGQLLNGNQEIAPLRLVRESLSYTLSVDGATADKPEVRLVRPEHPNDVSSRIFIKNSDPFPYDLRFTIDLDSGKCWERSRQTFSIGANTSKELYLNCDPTLFDWFRTGFLKSDTRVRQAALDVMLPDSEIVLTTKRPPVTAVISYFSEWAQQLSNVFWSLLILIVGALLSVAMTIVLPNYRRKKDLLRRLRFREVLTTNGPVYYYSSKRSDSRGFWKRLGSFLRMPEPD
jgi:hypothetical protein